MVSEKDPVKARAGVIGARARWADHLPKRVRLDELRPEQARLVLALINAAKAAEPPERAA